MRFDDSLKTVLAADCSTASGAQAMFRQLVELVARGRAAPDAATLGRLRTLRHQVPLEVRAAVACGLAWVRPPIGLIEVFAEDDAAIASAALRSAHLPSDDWISLLPRLGPTGRAVLRRRDDLSPIVLRALESFGSSDPALDYKATPAIDKPTTLPLEPSSSMSVRESNDAPSELHEPGGFNIAELVDRIATFHHKRHALALAEAADEVVASFRFEADPDGTIRWADAAPRGAVTGISLAAVTGAQPQVDGVVAGAFRHRTSFCDARLSIGGGSALAGEWRISAVPTFDAATGRFTGYRGAARRPRCDESAARHAVASGSEGLRRLVHELRTPTNAIAGFSEMIEAQLLGSVSNVYRERARTIRILAADLIAAIEDLDLAARIEGGALELCPGVVPVAPMLARIADELRPLTDGRGCTAVMAPIDDTLALACDDRAAERLLARFVATMMSASQTGELIAVSAIRGGIGRGQAIITITRPRSLAGISEVALLNLDAEREADLPGAPLLGTGFALRLVRNLAVELGGQLSFLRDRFIVSLPAAPVIDMDQAAAN